MAENKKSFVLYSDSQGLVNQLPDDVAGRLLKHIYAYVNDENPVSDELLLNIAFEPIKQHLKRDLVKWQSTRETKSNNGNLGNLKRYNPDLFQKVESGNLALQDAINIAKTRKNSHSDNLPSQEVAKLAVNVSVNDSVSVSDNVNDIEIKNNIENRKLKFASTLKPFVDVFGRDTIKDFYEYWTEPNKSNTKFRQELEKTWSLERRLQTWSKNENNFKKPNKNEKHEQLTEIAAAARIENPKR
jgi:hypothetical protein